MAENKWVTGVIEQLRLLDVVEVSDISLTWIQPKWWESRPGKHHKQKLEECQAMFWRPKDREINKLWNLLKHIQIDGKEKHHRRFVDPLLYILTCQIKISANSTTFHNKYMLYLELVDFANETRINWPRV